MIERAQRTAERTSLIDLLKFICACSIVYIHTIVPFVGGVAGEIGRIISGFVNPVGFFMICTAYFSFVKNYDAEKDRINMTGIGNVCGRLYVLYFVWLMPYLYWELKLNFQAESVTIFGAVNAWLLWAVCIIAGMIGTAIIIKVLKYPGLWWVKQILNF